MIFYLFIIASFVTCSVRCQGDLDVPAPPAELRGIPPPSLPIEDNEVDVVEVERNINSTSSLNDVKGDC